MLVVSRHPAALRRTSLTRSLLAPGYSERARHPADSGEVAPSPAAVADKMDRYERLESRGGDRFQTTDRRSCNLPLAWQVLRPPSRLGIDRRTTTHHRDLQVRNVDVLPKR